MSKKVVLGKGFSALRLGVSKPFFKEMDIGRDISELSMRVW